LGPEIRKAREPNERLPIIYSYKVSVFVASLECFLYVYFILLEGFVKLKCCVDASLLFMTEHYKFELFTSCSCPQGIYEERAAARLGLAEFKRPRVQQPHK